MKDPLIASHYSLALITKQALVVFSYLNYFLEIKLISINGVFAYIFKIIKSPLDLKFKINSKIRSVTTFVFELHCLFSSSNQFFEGRERSP